MERPLPVWARGYFCHRSGNVTDEVIKAYSARQDHSTDEVFRLEGDRPRQGIRHEVTPRQGTHPRLRPA
jgi:hypothetical protein